MAQTAAEAAVMESAAGKFERVDDSLQSMLSRLMNELEALQTAWRGAGGNSFTNVKMAYQENQKALSRALRETASAIRTSGQQYTATDDEQASMVGGINTSVSLPL
jgi:WXG100 family type VII secretion target